jgi:hypothetical protein
MAKKGRRRRKKAMGKQKKRSNMELSTASSTDVAVRLLYVQQRIEALERLYNEEVSDLRRDVSEMKLAVVREAQSQGRLSSETRAPTDASDTQSDE